MMNNETGKNELSVFHNAASISVRAENYEPTLKKKKTKTNKTKTLQFLTSVMEAEVFTGSEQWEADERQVCGVSLCVSVLLFSSM